MEYRAIENYIKRAKGSIYKLSRMAAIRALELAEGRKQLVDMPLSSKLTSVSLEEIKQGKIEMKGANSVSAQEKKAIQETAAEEEKDNKE